MNQGIALGNLSEAHPTEELKLLNYIIADDLDLDRIIHTKKGSKCRAADSDEMTVKCRVEMLSKITQGWPSARFNDSLCSKETVRKLG